MVDVAGRPSAGGPGRKPDLAESKVEGGVELDESPVDVVEIAQGDAEQPFIIGDEGGDGAIVGPIGRIAQGGVGDIKQGRAQRGVDDLVLEAEQVERGRALRGVDGAERGVPLRSLAHEVAAEGNEIVALAGGP
jgi:hypothetical protein